MVCYLDTVKTSDIHFKSLLSWMAVVMQMLPVSKEAFSLLSMSKMAAFGMDIKVYRHSQALNGGFFQVK